MNTYNLAIIGFGGVTRALAQLIVEDPHRIASQGIGLRVVAISDLAMGSLVEPEGIDLAAVLALPRGSTFAGLSGGSGVADNEAIIRTSNADIIAEATFTNPLDGEPAASHVRWALESGKHVITTNKGPIALYGESLKQCAAENGVHFAFEGAVMSGTPVIGLARNLLTGLTVLGVQGILNGTSNYVLGRMETGVSLEDAVAAAQNLGFAEADPGADIGGSDVQLKLSILANELLGASLSPADVATTGIVGVTAEKIAAAAQQNKRFKLIGSAYRNDDGTIVAEVAPVALTADHPLANISGVTNAVSFDTDLLGIVTIAGPGAGRTETAFALLADILAVHAFEGAKVNG
ncbi:homoserine dehydrogenase [Microbacterium sp. cx-59]|uniref:homoserine dehydrogenase n=1 Tax=Microbacterium sp. cx-59 TaxID=2891207 RepID=UPI001E48C8E0|nr:homoserine dehydrogenase [Microbacterium sp. cx-59]MCC4908888.1 homoserine dehydrogenase [Microbacterium sp. cx-59]